MNEELFAVLNNRCRKLREYHNLSEEPIYVGDWIDGSRRYTKVVEITDTTLIQKGNAFKVCDLPEGFKMLIHSTGIIKTYEGSYSNDDILIYSTREGIMAKQNFTGYPEKMYIIIEYNVEE